MWVDALPAACVVPWLVLQLVGVQAQLSHKRHHLNQLKCHSFTTSRRVALSQKKIARSCKYYVKIRQIYYPVVLLDKRLGSKYRRLRAFYCRQLAKFIIGPTGQLSVKYAILGLVCYKPTGQCFPG